MGRSRGKVYLVGAGLGNDSTLTLGALHALRQAEVVVYDALVDEQLLHHTPADCLKIYAGKRGGQPSTPQAEVDRLLVAHCTQGKQVVRLKSGDPFVFGRVRSEMAALQAAGCTYEVIPGVSSALAAPALAGIPLTDADLSQCFAVVTGHQPEVLDWHALAQLDTLAILMGTRRLVDIVQLLQAAGKSPNCPVAIVREAGQPQQRVWTGTLATIAQEVSDRTISDPAISNPKALSPAVIVVGEVVRLREELRSPPSDLPLAGKTILVTRSAGQSGEFAQMLQGLGARVGEVPALEIGAPSSWEPLDRAIAQMQQFDWLVLTSGNGVENFFGRLAARGWDARALAGVKVAVVGKKTAACLCHYGIRPDFVPPDFVADVLVETFPEPVAGKRFLFPRVETGGREVLVREFTDRGAAVVEVPAYESRCPERLPADALHLLQNQTVDAVTFASSKTVKHFMQLAIAHLDRPTWEEWIQRVGIASIGPQTSAACREVFGRVDVEAQEYTLEGLAAALTAYLGSTQ